MKAIREILANKSFRIFLLTFCCILIITNALTLSFHIKETRKEKLSYISKVTEQTQHINDYFSQNFDVIINTCNTIFLSQWYNHYRNISNIYADEFTVLRRIEITADIQSITTALPYVSDILIITPYSDSIIHKRGWSSVSDYLKIYGLLDITLPHDITSPPIVSPADASFCIITLEDPTPRLYKSIVAVLIDKKSFFNTLVNILPESASYARAELNGQTLCELGELTDRLIVNNSYISRPKFSITIGFSRYEDTAMAKSRMINYTLIQIIVLFLSIIFSIIISIFSLKPLNKIVYRLGGKERIIEDPYNFISKYIENLNYQYTQLYIEKDTLKKSLDRFIVLLNKEILFGMLTNPNFDFSDKNIISSIPWINEKYPFVLVLLEPKFSEGHILSNSSSFDPLASLALHYYSFEIYPNILCLLFWFENIETANSKYPELCSSIKHHSKHSYYYAASEILENPEDMRNAYVLLKEKITNQKHVHLDLPLSMEIELINNLRTDKQGECISLLNKAKSEDKLDAFMWLLVRVATEYNIDSSPIIKNYFQYARNHSINKQMDLLAKFIEDLCQSINSYKYTLLKESAEAICQYIEENFSNPDLSINLIADHFNIHRTLVSKILKSQLNITYSDYILNLRIKRAMELLKDTDLSISSIANKVGYASYTTFKRAFIRYTGYSPSKFREDLP